MGNNNGGGIRSSVFCCRNKHNVTRFFSWANDPYHDGTEEGRSRGVTYLPDTQNYLADQSEVDLEQMVGG